VWVTVYADASFNPVEGGGWGVWVRSERGRFVRRGKCPPYVKTSGEAELAAIYAGVCLALRAWKGEVRGFFVRSDSQEALFHAVPAAPLSRAPAVRRLQQKLRELLGPRIEVHAKWVKGHQKPSNGTAAYLNAACDKLAKRGRRSR
jgi:ribonuclease HI